jgi:hypothetical protein
VDVPFIVLTIVAALFLPRHRALLATVALWAVAVAMVGWGPAHSDNVTTASLEFWLPWSVALLVGLALALGITALRNRGREGTPDAGSLPTGQRRAGLPVGTGRVTYPRRPHP